MWIQFLAVFVIWKQTVKIDEIRQIVEDGAK